MATIRERYLGFFDIYSRLAGFLSRSSLIATYILLGLVTSVAVLAVFYRYVLNDPIQWAEEIARYILIWMTLIAASIAIKERKHVNLPSILIRLPKKIALLIEMTFYLIIIFIIGIIAHQSLIMVITRSVRVLSASLQISMVWAHAALPVGFGLILIQSLYILFEDIKMFIEEESLRRKING
ncbi:MAG: TRAP transporter small permease subunit [Proteobacteria bacterium]|nr:TRAP transporter small permease subunit [Pseudomonadota bacterium]